MTGNPAHTDQKILHFLRAGDRQSISMIYQYHYDAVLSHVTYIVNNRQDAEDLVQELFLSIWEKRNKLQLSPPLRPYLLAASHNRALNFIESRSKSNPYLSKTLDEDLLYVESGKSESGRKEMHDRIQKAINKLPPKTRTPFILSRNFNMTNKEIAIKLHLSVKTIEKHMSKAIRLLRKFLRP